jgi:hypothetical protein
LARGWLTIFLRAAVAVAVAEAAAEAVEERAQEAEPAAAAQRAVAADTGLRPDAHPPCRGRLSDLLLGHPATGQARAQEAAASGPAVQIVRRWATCRRPARGRVLRGPAELDPARAAGRATSPIDLVELAPAARDLEPAVDRAILLAAARGPAPAQLLAAVGHRLATLETSSIWVGPAAVAPVFDPAQQRPAALRQLSYMTRQADLTLARDRKEAAARAPVISPLTRDLDKAAADNNCSPERDPDKAAAVFNDRQPCQAKMVVECNGQQLGRAKAAPASSGRQPAQVKVAAAFNDPQPAQVKMAVEFNGLRLGPVKTVVEFNVPPLGQARTAAVNAGIAAIGPTIAPIASTTATNGTTGVKITSHKSTTTGKTIGKITTIGLTTTGGAIITIPITIGTRAKIGGAGPRSAR